MSEKQLPYHIRKRLPRIIRGLLQGETYDDIAKDLNVTRRTIERDVHAWRQSGGLEDYFSQEFFKLHAKVAEKDVVEAYKQICKLLGKTLTRRIEAQLAAEGTLKVELWQPEKGKDAKGQQ